MYGVRIVVLPSILGRLQHETCDNHVSTTSNDAITQMPAYAPALSVFALLGPLITSPNWLSISFQLVIAGRRTDVSLGLPFFPVSRSLE